VLRRWALAVASLAGVGCLNAGAPPTGRHWLVDRDHEEVQLIAAPGGERSRILLTLTQSQPHSASGTAEQLSTVDDPGPAGVAVVRVLADQLGTTGQICPEWGGCRPHVDSLGRLWLDRETFSPSTTTPGSYDQIDELLRVDPATGASTIFGSFSSLTVSSDGTRAAFAPVDPTFTGRLLVEDVAGHETPLVGVLATFVGDDLFFISAAGLARVPRGSDTPDALAADVSSFTAYDTSRGWLLLLLRVPELGSGVRSMTTSLFDVATATETSLPPMTAAAQTFAPSPSGRYLVAVATPLTSSIPVTLYDRDTAQETAVSEDIPYYVTPTWRPGRDEVWFWTSGDTIRWQAQGSPASVGPAGSIFSFPPLVPVSPQEIDTTGQPVFTPDGTFRLVTPTPRDALEREPVRVQSADDPTTSPQLLNPPGTELSGLWPLPDGRLLVEASITDVERNDTYLVDPAASTSRGLTSTGHVVATGRDRVLALLHWVDEGASGDLTSIDYATGTQTLIAENVHSVAVDVSATPGDALAPGTRVVYLVRNRIASPYDGLWTIELP
jgi:hypothetical protein